jgi:hypothetical protein
MDDVVRGFFYAYCTVHHVFILYILYPMMPDALVIQTRRSGYGFIRYGYGYDADQKKLILIRTRGTRIHQPGGYPVPMSNTIPNSVWC